jgi:hypothetical protein
VRLNLLDTAPPVSATVAPEAASLVPEALAAPRETAAPNGREQLVREILDILASRGL